MHFAITKNRAKIGNFLDMCIMEALICANIQHSFYIDPDIELSNYLHDVQFLWIQGLLQLFTIFRTIWLYIIFFPNIFTNSVEEWFRVLIVKMYVVCSINTLIQKLKSAFSWMLYIYSTNSIITQHEQDPCLSGSQESGNFKRIIFNKPVKSVAYVIKSQFAFSCKFNSSEFGLICFLPLICVKDD